MLILRLPPHSDSDGMTGSESNGTSAPDPACSEDRVDFEMAALQLDPPAEMLQQQGCVEPGARTSSSTRLAKVDRHDRPMDQATT